MRPRPAAILCVVTALCACQPTASDHHRAEDIAAIQQVAVAIDHAVDEKRWADIPRFFAKEITVDVTSLAGGSPAVVTPEQLADGWAANLGTGFGQSAKTSFHQRGPGIVRIKGNKATLISKGYSWNRMEDTRPEGGEPLWEVWGTYTYDLRRRARPRAGDATAGTDGAPGRKRSPWVVTAMTLDVAAQRGNDWVRDTPSPE